MSLDLKFDKQSKGVKKDESQQDIQRYDTDSPSRVLYLIDSKGEHWSFHYAQINLHRYQPEANTIILHTSSFDVTLKGANLLGLFQEISEQRIRTVRTIESRYAATKEKSDVYVTSVTIEHTSAISNSGN